MSKTRLFTLRWDHSKTRVRPEEKRECEGVQFGVNGFIALSNGSCFTTMSEMEHHLRAVAVSKFEVLYADEQGQAVAS